MLLGEPRGPSLGRWWIQVPSWRGRILLQEFDGEMGGDKTQEDFGAVNDFPASIFSQGRLQIPINVEEEGDRGMLQEMGGC